MRYACRYCGRMFVTPSTRQEHEMRACVPRVIEEKEEDPMLLAQLKNFVVDRLDLEELFALSAYGKMVRNEYQNRNLPPPEWLLDQLSVLDREILARRRDELEKRLKEIKAQQTGLETTVEKRERLARERQELEAQLNSGAVIAEVAKA